MNSVLHKRISYAQSNCLPCLNCLCFTWGLIHLRLEVALKSSHFLFYQNLLELLQQSYALCWGWWDGCSLLTGKCRGSFFHWWFPWPRRRSCRYPPFLWSVMSTIQELNIQACLSFRGSEAAWNQLKTKTSLLTKMSYSQWWFCGSRATEKDGQSLVILGSLANM